MYPVCSLWILETAARSQVYFGGAGAEEDDILHLIGGGKISNFVLHRIGE